MECTDYTIGPFCLSNEPKAGAISFSLNSIFLVSENGICHCDLDFSHLEGRGLGGVLDLSKAEGDLPRHGNLSLYCAAFFLPPR